MTRYKPGCWLQIPVAKLSLVKRSDDGKVDGIQFKLEKKQMTGTTGPTQRERWDLIGTYTTHDGGIILPEEFGALDYDGMLNERSSLMMKL